MTTISAIIITKNEEQNIRRCLESLRWVDEIIVIDSGSTDDTVSICKEYTANVFHYDWPGYGPQKNRALAKATKEWVLSIDADEWLSDGLIQEIQQTVKNNPAIAYYIPRKNLFMGKAINYGDWGKDKVLRLFQREQGKFTEDLVHERIITSGNIQLLKNPLFHATYKNLEHAIAKMNLYTSLTAEKKKRRSPSISKALLSSIWTFSRSYFLRRGFLDGKAGLILSFYLAENSFYRNVKVIEHSMSQLVNQKNQLK